MTARRKEHDLLGERHVPAGALHGIHTERALENFSIAARRVSPALVHAYGAVKLACARTNHELGRWDADTFAAIETACIDVAEGRLDEHIVVDALQGGAGTSTNMNVNEVIANRALQLLGEIPGEYDIVSPSDDINLHQSTNDTFPTALRVAAIARIRCMENALVELIAACQEKEKAFAHVVKIGRTEYQDAVLTTLGRSMGAYAEAFGRDRWRIHKCEERLRVVNLGGTAIGTGLGAPRQFIFRATEHLRQVTGFGLARAENLVEATQNADAFVEVHGLLKACASNLLKVTNDLRYLSSGPEAGIGEITLPARQAGSSIMPGKVNPVIPEAVAQAAMVVMGNDQTVAIAASLGHLELNAFLPLIADRLLDSIDVLTNACTALANLCLRDLVANEQRCRQHVNGSTATVTALVEAVGYETAQRIAREATDTDRSIRDIAIDGRYLGEGEFDDLVSPERTNRLGSPMPRRAEQ